MAEDEGADGTGAEALCDRSGAVRSGAVLSGAGVAEGVADLDKGVEGGGMAPFGGPYCRIGRKTGCGAGLLGSFTAKTVASK